MLEAIRRCNLKPPVNARVKPDSSQHILSVTDLVHNRHQCKHRRFSSLLYSNEHQNVRFRSSGALTDDGTKCRGVEIITIKPRARIIEYRQRRGIEPFDSGHWSVVYRLCVSVECGLNSLQSDCRTTNCGRHIGVCARVDGRVYPVVEWLTARICLIIECAHGCIAENHVSIKISGWPCEVKGCLQLCRAWAAASIGLQLSCE